MVFLIKQRKSLAMDFGINQNFPCTSKIKFDYLSLNVKSKTLLPFAAGSAAVGGAGVGFWVVLVDAKIKTTALTLNV